MKKGKGTASEKAAHAARALRAARRAQRAQRAASETAGKALTWSGKARIRRSSATPAEVPPFCFLRPGLAPEEAAIAAVKALGMSHPADALHTLWKLRAFAQAERSSAQSAAQVHVAPAAGDRGDGDAHKSTHKHPRQRNEQVVITPGHRGKTEPAREETEKDASRVAASGHPINH